MSAEALVAKIKIDEEGVTIDRYLVFDPDRHGNPRYYFRQKGRPKIRLRAEPGTPAFLDEFKAAYSGARGAPAAAAAAASKPSTDIRRTPPQWSLAWLFNEYERRAETFKELDDSTKSRRRTVMDQICAEPTSEDDPQPIGLRPFKTMGLRVLKVIRDRCPTPGTSNARVKALRMALKFALDEEWLGQNPARDLAYKRSKSTGYHSWTMAEVEQYEKCWAVGTVQRLAMGILLYTGDRRSDAVALGKQHRKRVNGVVGWQFTQFKGRNKSPVTLWLPVLAPLQALIDATPSKGLTYLETSFGNAFTRKGFGTQFKKWCRKAGLPHCSAHGLRKAAATRMAENGATERQLMMIFGWKTIGQALIYTLAAEQKRMAAGAMHMMLESPASVSPGSGVAV